MKRRLSVAISLIGHSTVVFLDEPSTGLDPNSRRLLWEAIRKAKKTKAILLTSNPFASFSHEPAHSMEEAEALCDRVGIYSNGELLAVGHPREVLVSLFSVWLSQLTSRFSDTLELTVSTDDIEEHLDIVLEHVMAMSKKCKKVYACSGTQKFEIPASDIPLEKIFIDMDSLKLKLPIKDWGVAHASLEDVFLHVVDKTK
jgi:ABC-type multidrug transport system ATPase subunit